ncbi:uncharacterized protein ASCRUDRAFT_83981 [Ascoidea rubescens DSM 1968]|uniref:FHA domain-containing protein n=1 Tax=Ascoidea rubescens DSM 1968 TaxID=1344418 RepID=A0A1D2VR89_9ASCO|nr:hypothetical protein ASCRUDRAFT_83981 [Ascoidea rubescens DSM 1968]ODV64126.1 hypothetical protein ASCRUDRAFT_83981 [Ascoidea rubescens DSM 1968]
MAVANSRSTPISFNSSLPKNSPSLPLVSPQTFSSSNEDTNFPFRLVKLIQDVPLVIGRSSKSQAPSDSNPRKPKRYNGFINERTLSASHCKICKQLKYDPQKKSYDYAYYLWDCGSQHGVIFKNYLLPKGIKIKLNTNDVFGLIATDKSILLNNIDNSPKNGNLILNGSVATLDAPSEEWARVDESKIKLLVTFKILPDPFISLGICSNPLNLKSQLQNNDIKIVFDIEEINNIEEINKIKRQPYAIKHKSPFILSKTIPTRKIESVSNNLTFNPSNSIKFQTTPSVNTSLPKTSPNCFQSDFLPKTINLSNSATSSNLFSGINLSSNLNKILNPIKNQKTTSQNDADLKEQQPPEKISKFINNDYDDIDIDNVEEEEEEEEEEDDDDIDLDDVDDVDDFNDADNMSEFENEISFAGEHLDSSSDCNSYHGSDIESIDEPRTAQFTNNILDKKSENISKPVDNPTGQPSAPIASTSTSTFISISTHNAKSPKLDFTFENPQTDLKLDSTLVQNVQNVQSHTTTENPSSNEESISKEIKNLKIRINEHELQMKRELDNFLSSDSDKNSNPSPKTPNSFSISSLLSSPITSNLNEIPIDYESDLKTPSPRKRLFSEVDESEKLLFKSSFDSEKKSSNESNLNFANETQIQIENFEKIDLIKETEPAPEKEVKKAKVKGGSVKGFVIGSLVGALVGSVATFGTLASLAEHFE